MLVLTWLSIVLLVIALCVYIAWMWREPRIDAKWIRNSFFIGVLAFFAIFIAFTWQTMSTIPQRTHAAEITPSVVAGKMAWQKYICIDCHTILGNGSYYAPDLTKAWNRFLDRSGGDEVAAKNTLIAYLRNPPGATSSRRGMPNVNMPAADAAAIADFLRWTSRIDTNGWPPAPQRAMLTPAPANTAAVAHSAGRDLFASSGCAACHSIGSGPVVGPDLAKVADKYDRATLTEWIRDPAAIYRARGKSPLNDGYPTMPALGLSRDDAAKIADYLASAGRS